MKKISFRHIRFKIKYGIFNKKITLKEYKVAEEYLMKRVDVDIMEKDLLLRGSSRKKMKRLVDAYEYLRKLSNIPQHVKEEKKLEGGILDGIRRSE